MKKFLQVAMLLVLCVFLFVGCAVAAETIPTNQSIIEKVIAFFQTNWIPITVVFLAFHKFLVSIRDVIDKTPNTDDNFFERAVTILGKFLGYITTGKRPA